MDANSAPRRPLHERVLVIRGAGEMATGLACRLYRANFRRLLMLEVAAPLAVRRRVSFCEAVHHGRQSVEGIEAVYIERADELSATWHAGKIAVLVDPRGEILRTLHPDVFIDATLAKRNLGTRMTDALFVVGLGPGFTAGVDCHVVVETNRGHDLGRIITEGAAEPNTGIPGDIGGFTSERVLRAPADGILSTELDIGAQVKKGQEICRVGDVPVATELDGILRGLIRPGSRVAKGLKIGDVDPRGNTRYCDTISEKARSIGGAVLEAVLGEFNR